ncbi:hypothetical protein FisN_40Lh003 [Fistulifera solaris]|uniref:Uncharacterized protein n=1 Tax=Fistulifera solaris TaxID=1519565 RepID=A0A1Z5J9A7_FISSO|nr:hypothetical protein FisN_40Lh003 [Fistulifera solaris]|eukprot:GAX10536.1 hypothetical protein FisN_40Lh003 [Fistulifera solaris]
MTRNNNAFTQTIKIIYLASQNNKHTCQSILDPFPIMPSKSYRWYALSLWVLLSRQLWRSIWFSTKEDKSSSDSMMNERMTLPSLLSLFPREPNLSASFLKDPSSWPTESIFENVSENVNQYSDVPAICMALPIGPSAASVWIEQQERILQATALFENHLPWMRRLFVTLTPDVLEQGLIVLPWLDRLRTTFTPWKRHETLIVAVMGGSVAEGRGCEVLPRAELKEYRSNATEPKVDSRQCTWVHRLQLLADAFDLPIQIFNLATGGTNSFLALPVLEYQLYHSERLKEMGGPHVVINAYAPNDALYSWSWDTAINNATAHYDHYHETWQAASQFVSAAASSCQQNPLVIFVNDYYGNHHDRLLAEEIRHDAVRQVAQDSGNMYVSPVIALRPYVWGNTRETLFSPPWWTRKQKGKPLERKRDAHFGMPGHIAVTWMVAYSLLRVAIEYCEHERHERGTMRTTATFNENDVPSIINTPLSLPTLWNTTFVEWQERLQQSKLPVQPCSKNGPCLFAFVANPAGTHRLRGKLANYIAIYEVSNTGWQAEDDIRNGWQNKLGLCAHSVGAELVLEFRNITQPVKTISLHSLKSYGPAWENSVAQFNVTVRHSSAIVYETSFEITGFHNQTTSLTYPFQLELPSGGATPGTDLEIRMTLVQGSNFKITSLLLCDR